MLVETEEVIQKYYPHYTAKKNPWKRLYPYAYTAYDECPFRFFCNYLLKHKVVLPHIVLVGKRCHAMKELYFKRVKVERLSSMLSSGKSDGDIAKYVLRHFEKCIHDEDEAGGMTGFAAMDSARLRIISTDIGSDPKTLRKYYLPSHTELKLNCGNFGGRLDTIFRLPDGYYMPLDWKDGLSIPKAHKGEVMLYDSIKTQMHIYGILIDDMKMRDEFFGEINTIRSKKYGVAYPRHVITVVKDYEPFIKQTIRENVVEHLDNINDDYFPMQVGEFTCGFGAGSYLPCGFFAPVCSKILVNDFGYEVLKDGSVSAGVEG